jgi:aspartate/tyrosine/aromatic aminotransferase
MFERFEPPPPDNILSLVSLFRDDPRSSKIDLGIGVYRDSEGRTPILQSVREAERRLYANEQTKAYVSPSGDPRFQEAVARLVFGPRAPHERIRAVQTPGGGGALGILTGLIAQSRPNLPVWVPVPTWGNHISILQNAGLEIRPYPYYDAARGDVDFARMMETLRKASSGEVVLLHGCCHNPTGADLTQAQWKALAALICDRGLFPFIDIAYQGFGDGLEVDAAATRLLVSMVPEAVVASSCSKNFGIYKERTGAAFVIAETAERATVAQAQLSVRARVAYSMPPDHGGSIVRIILEDPALAEQWRHELEAMRQSISRLRGMLADELGRTTDQYAFIRSQKGMFSQLGISEPEVHRLRREFGIYIVDDGRINIAGLRESDIRGFADALLLATGC